MDTKSKSSRRFRIGIIIAVLLLVAAVNVCLFPEVKKKAEASLPQQNSGLEDEVDKGSAFALYKGAYVLYTEFLEGQQGQPANRTGFFVPNIAQMGNVSVFGGLESTEEYVEYEYYDYIAEWSDEFEHYRSRVDYYATNGIHSVKNTDSSLENVLHDDFDTEDKQNKLNTEYEYLIVLNFDENGMMSVDVKKTTNLTAESLIKVFLQADRYNEIRQCAKDNGDVFEPVKDFQVVYGIPWDGYILDTVDHYMSGYYLLKQNGAGAMYRISFVLIMLFLVVMSSKKIWKNDDLPDYLPAWRDMEIGLAGFFSCFLLGDLYIDIAFDFPYSTQNGWNDVTAFRALQTYVGVLAIFALMFVSGLMLYPVFTLGVKEYVIRYSLIYQIFPWVKSTWKKFVDEMEHLDFHAKSTKTIIKIVVANFLVLAVLMCMWMFGIIGLIVYSIVLFFLLKRYYNKISTNYEILMKGTSRIADGDLDTVITEDIGVFEPFKEELAKIQNGFKKAVEEEVKSQRLKTELITNVSHDLKTPLTAITTYVALLKKEDITEEERKSYIDTLEKKSLRLKVLIEDLFEVSKATSNNITLDLMDVDVINLMKQVSIEHTDSFEKMGLQVKWNVPGEKVVLKLDNQKTYRIFENLFVNIEKYAMQNSRVYIDVICGDENVTITIKNMSAIELNVRPEELTERFVRGDKSRNTEGSGLGLAIAKSFTEAQKGTLDISVDGDLFKVVITWKLMYT